MASARKRKGSRFWYACYSVKIDGKLERFQEPTKFVGNKEKSKAVAVAEAAEELARQGATADAAKQILFDVVERIQGKKVSDESIAEYVARWRGRKSAEVAKGTAEKYEDIEKSLRESLGEKFMSSPISQVTPAQLSKWRDAITKRISASTVNSYIAIVKQIFQDAADEGEITKSPAAKLKKFKVSKLAVRRAFSPEELAGIFAHADDEWLGISLAGLYTGQGISDIVLMDLDEIGADRWWRSDRRKSEAQIAIPLAAPLIKWIREKHGSKKRGKVFPEAFALMESSGGKVSRLSSRFRKIMVAAGIIEPRDHKKTNHGAGRGGRRKTSEITFHSFRHTNTTLLKSAGVSETVAMALVGHETSENNRIYTHLPESVLKEAADKLPDFTKILAFRAG